MKGIQRGKRGIHAPNGVADAPVGRHTDLSHSTHHVGPERRHLARGPDQDILSRGYNLVGQVAPRGVHLAKD